eukprot:g11010.t1
MSPRKKDSILDRLRPYSTWQLVARCAVASCSTLRRCIFMLIYVTIAVTKYVTVTSLFLFLQRWRLISTLFYLAAQHGEYSRQLSALFYMAACSAPRRCILCEFTSLLQ